MHSCKFLLDLAIILLSIKLLGVTTTRVRMPQVADALMAGFFGWPAMFGVLSETDFLRAVAELDAVWAQSYADTNHTSAGG